MGEIVTVLLTLVSNFPEQSTYEHIQVLKANYEQK
jgi:hypothetical protein